MYKMIDVKHLEIKKEIMVELLDGSHMKYKLPCTLLEIEQNKEDARLYSALKYIVQSNLVIPHNLTSKPDDEYEIDYQSRLKTAQMIASEFKELTGYDIHTKQSQPIVEDEKKN